MSEQAKQVIGIFIKQESDAHNVIVEIDNPNKPYDESAFGSLVEALLYIVDEGYDLGEYDTEPYGQDGFHIETYQYIQ